MTPERWHRIEEVFHAALHRGANERSRFLDSACARDPQLRREVEALLASYERTGSFMDRPFSPDAFRVIADESPTESIGGRLAPGDLVLGRFEIVRSLGQGGMGEVYEARDLKLDRSVALKTLGAGIEHDPNALYRFKQEFRTLAEFRHPNLVRLYELFSDGQRWFFTMELVDGVDFLAYVRPGDQLDERRLRQSLIQLAEGLTALHAGGKLHLDVKPSNVLITVEGRVQVIDFGLVTERQGTEPSDMVLGTPAYMAPEQGANAPLSEASDWYSFGVMIYEALTGQRPFTGSALDISHQKRAHESAAPSRLCLDVPQDLDILCVDLLRRDPTARPRGGDILQRVGAMREQLAVDGARDAPLVGRQHELKLLRDAYDECRAGRPVLASVSGSSGAGKTALIRRFLRTLQDSEHRLVLLSSRCYETETVPFKAIDGLIDGLSRYLKRLAPVNAAALLPRDIHALVRLFPVLGQVDTIATAPATTASTERQEVRRRGFAALRELLARIADRSPLVIWIDDIQWADRDSFALLTDVLGHLDAPGSFVIMCHRDERTDVAQDLETLSSLAASVSTVRRLQLADLSYEESLELAGTLLHDLDLGSVTLEQLARDGAGSPFFVHQLAQFARTPAANVGDQPSPAPARAPSTFATMFARRVASLPEPASHLLDLLALAGRPLTIEQLSAAAGFNIHDDAALPILRTEKLVRTRPWQGEIEVEPFHDRIREGVVAAVSTQSRPQYHLTLAGTLEKYTQDFEAIAHHFNAGGKPEQAGIYAERAGDNAAAALAFDRAASLYQMAMQLSSQPDGKQRLRLSLAQALADAGRGPEAAQQCLEAARSSVGITSLQLKQRAAEQLLRSGHLNEGLDVLRQVAIAVGLRLSTSQRWVLVGVAVRRLQLWLRGLRYREQDASLIDPHELLRIDLCWSLALGWSIVDTLRGAEAQALHLALALRSGEPGRVAMALAAEAGYATARSKRSLRRVPDLLASAFETAERTNNPRALALATFSAGMQSWAYGDFPKAFELCEQAEDTYRTRCTGVAFEIETSQIFALACLAWMGRLKELAARLVPLRRAAEQRGDRYGSASLTLLTHSWLLRLAEDDPDLAEREIAETMQAWPSRGFHLQHFWALFGRFESTLYRGETGLAAEIAEKQRGAIRRSLLLVNPAARFFAAHLHACSSLAAASDVRHLPAFRDQRLREAAKGMRIMSRQQMLPSRPMVELMSAGASAIRGHSDEARAWYASAERGFEAAHMDLYAVVARRRRGELTGGDEGRTLIASADSWMQSQSVRNPSRLTATLAPV